MTIFLQYLADHHVLFTFLLVGVGMFLGEIKVKGVSLGAAAVLFLAIAISAWGVAEGVATKSTPGHGGIIIGADVGVIGLALFAFAIGNSSGKNFFAALKRATGPIIAMVAVLSFAAATAYFVGRFVFEMNPALIAGTFAGGITNTPALAAAGEASGNEAMATVGYAVAYLFGVLGMILAAGLALRAGKNDTDAPAKITHMNVRVEREDLPTVKTITEHMGGKIEISRMRQGETGKIWIPAEDDVIRKDDLLTIVGGLDVVNEAVKYLGHESSHSLRSDRRMLDFRRIIVSNHSLAGRSVAELDEMLEEKWGAKISRVRRGDTDFLAIPNMQVELGDRIRVVGPTYKLKEISKWFGDSTRGLSDINPVALGLGLALGYFIGEIEIPLPGGAHFAIGYAAGILIVALLMGYFGRVGRLVTALPFSTNQVIAEIGLLMFLARAGTNAGPQIGQAFSGGDWWKILILGMIITTTVGFGLHLVQRGIFKMGGTQLAGFIGGTQTQPAVLGFANARTGADPRVAVGYALAYPGAMIIKILLAYIVGSL
ncbi:aspartate:alanine exchanger family transporter [Arcanobacterium bovis]|uniref:Transporter n=1 Tax=Arcanobacterium bovis TaxID=2529275 RepID=A0A4Q9UYV6_9ACTO|nr:TrkA C-terminal domain-containing protein [Arcanobacterium bovis]TBW20908.1 transporter [Arcanobacterium bovis]